MKSIDFPGATLKIGANQTDIYNVIHAMPVGGPEGEIIACFELTDDEIEEIVSTKKIYYHRWTFNGLSPCLKCGTINRVGFSPMRITTSLEDGIELLPDAAN